MKDAQIKPGVEDYAEKSVGQRPNYAATKHVQIKLSKVEFTGGMGQR